MGISASVKSGDGKTEKSLPGKAVTVYLSLGSNMGDKEKILESSICSLNNHASIAVKNVSNYFLTEPVDGNSGNMFYNCAVEIETTLEPLDLLDTIEEIETRHGRTAKRTNSPRTLDIDIILYGGMVVSFPRLKIPHPKMAWRKFVLHPLRQIAPDLKHPILNKTCAELAMDCEESRFSCEIVDNPVFQARQ